MSACVALLLPATLALLSGCRYAAVGQNIEGTRLLAQGNYNGALQRFQQAVANDPASADAYYNMGRTFHEIGKQTSNEEQLATAETLYNQCLDVEPDHVDCHRALAVLLVDTERPDRAFALLRNWATRSPNNADARIELARLYHEFGDTETARLHLDDAIALDLTNPRAWTARGNLREEQGDVRQALENYQRSYQLNTLQPALAQRIASLQRSNQSGLSLPTFNGTRTVNNGGSSVRY
jgi:tetratricopeptide (TPR) repeat protein